MPKEPIFLRPSSTGNFSQSPLLVSSLRPSSTAQFPIGQAPVASAANSPLILGNSPISGGFVENREVNGVQGNDEAEENVKRGGNKG